MASKVIDMTIGSPARHILKFAVPLICGYMLQYMYQIIDAAIVGRFIGVDALAAVGASTSIIFLILGFCNGCCSGFAIPVAQAFGAADYSKMRTYISNAVRLSVVIAILFTVFAALLCGPILHLVQTPADVFKDAYKFLFITILSIPFIIAYNLLSAFMRSLGNSRVPFYFLILSSLINILLDFVLIIEMKIGVEGAAFATMFSQALAAYWCYVYIKKKMQILLPQGTERKYDKKKALTLLNNGIPMGLQFSITAIGIMMLQRANNALGTLYVATFVVSLRVKYFFTCVLENLGVAMATYCGQNLGAHKMQRISQGIRAAIKITVVYVLITVVIMYLFAADFTYLFVDPSQTEIVKNSAMYLQINSDFYMLLGLLTIFRYSIQGLGYSNLSMCSGVAEMIARTGISIWLVPALGFLGVCLGDPTAWLLADMSLVPAWIIIYRRLKKKANCLEHEMKDQIS